MLGECLRYERLQLFLGKALQTPQGGLPGCLSVRLPASKQLYGILWTAVEVDGLVVEIAHEHEVREIVSIWPGHLGVISRTAGLYRTDVSDLERHNMLAVHKTC